MEAKEDNNLLTLPVLPMKQDVLYPCTIVPLYITPGTSKKTLNFSVATGSQLFITNMRDSVESQGAAQDQKHMEIVGTIANVVQALKLPDNSIKLLAEGVERGKIVRFLPEDEHLLAEVIKLEESSPRGREIEALMRTALSSFEEFIKLNAQLPLDLVTSLGTLQNAGRLADAISIHLPNVSYADKRRILETLDTKKRLQFVVKLLKHELALLRIEEKLKGQVKEQLSKHQHEFVLNEKMKAIQKELADLSGTHTSLSECAQLRHRITAAHMSPEATEAAEKELARLEMMPPLSAEATIARNYLDTLLGLPWHEQSDEHTDLTAAERILNEDHYGLEKVKERILEYIAVHNRVKKGKGAILCFIGPPGVGKTSLGRSIARAIGRKFTRISLGGVRDEAEIRGHRRTYIGAEPGKIIQKLAKTKVRNPLFLLDEIDKMAMDYNGDPASALLEVLDPEQNNTFNDHYLEVDFDLSDVMFIATANSYEIPSPLLDRLEIIPLAGYTEEEKIHIAKQHLIPKQIAANGLKAREITLHDDALVEIIRYYTREAGVRELERAIAKICRKTVKKIDLKQQKKKVVIKAPDVERFLGVRQFYLDMVNQHPLPGQVNGLAWTEVGGDLLTIEVAATPGKGKTLYTGRLGEVMQESISAALTVVRGRSQQLGIRADFYEKYDIHVHVPEGATPKDGPSAGITMCTALVSALTEIPVKATVAMTGEITLRGEVLPIGGLKEKLLAALHAGIKTVLIPEKNQKDLKELPKHLITRLEIKPVKMIDEVLAHALERAPKPLKRSSRKKTGQKTKAKTAKRTKRK